MDVFERDGGLTTADAVHKREEFRQIVSDVQDLPETQKTALLLREIDALSYDQIAEAMETTVPSVKSLLVRARVSLAEAAEARLLTCEEVRLELGQVAEGLAKTTPPARRHLKSCERCRLFKGELRRANRALAAVYPLGPLVIVKKFFIGKLGALAGSTGASTSGAAAGIGSGAGGAVAGSVGATAGAGAGGALSASFGAIATKAAAGLAAAALVTAAGVEVKQVAHPQGSESAHVAVQIASAQPAPPVAAPAPVRRAPAAVPAVVAAKQEPATANADAKTAKQPAPSTPAPATPPPDTTAAAPADTTTSSTSTQPAPQPTPVDPVQEDGSVVVLDPSGSNSTGDGSGNQWDQPGDGQGDPGAGGGPNSGPSGSGSTPPGESTGTPSSPQPAPVAGERAPAHRTIAAVRRVLRHR
jgi:hypothetical protein